MNSAIAMKQERGERHQRRRSKAKFRKKRAGVYILHRERLTGKGRLRQLMGYLTQVMNLPRLAEEIIRDSRRCPVYRGSTCILLCILMVLLRYRSFNSFEPRLTEPAMRKVFGNRPVPTCVDTLRNALMKVDLDTLEKLHQAIMRIAAKNKALRGTLHQGLRFFAFDGFEQIRSRKRSCPACLTATYESTGEVVTDHFHRFVFLHSIGPGPQLLLGLQPLASVSVRQATMPDAIKAEGELTAVKPAIDRLRKVFPKMYDVGIGDALYPNGPMLNFMKEGKPSYDLIAVLKKPTDEPLADALTLYASMAPTDIYYDEQREEWVRLWDTEGFQTLQSCRYPLRVIKAQRTQSPRNALSLINWDGPSVSTWWMVTTIPTERLTGPAVFDAQRRRWDQESVNNDFTQNWFIKHSFIHHETGTTAMAYVFMIAYNLFQLFWHRRLSEKTRKSYTMIAIADEMRLDLPQIRSRSQGLFDLGKA
jgi:hypothetical protein